MRRLGIAVAIFVAFLGLQSGIGFAQETSRPASDTEASSGRPAALTTLYSFCSMTDCADGFAPWSGLVEAKDGNLYGTTSGGGDDTPYQGLSYGVGVIYRITRSGTFTVLHRFNAVLEGAYPKAGLTVGADGYLYGAASAGGPSGGGCVFKISTDGDFTVLHQFAPGEGSFPYVPPVEDAAGNWYGTTLHGGSYNGGTVYQITREGRFVTLHDFSAWDDGCNPEAPLLLGGDGNFYSTTNSGGGMYNAGTVFRMTPDGDLTTLHQFGSQDDGSHPAEGLTKGSDGALYGTTNIGGAHGPGTVFRITQAGLYSSLYSFRGNNLNGPTSGLTLGNDGNFWGVRAQQGGVTSKGVIYRITPTGAYTELHEFNGWRHGAYPEAELLLGSDGMFYGTTLDGGKKLSGTIFRFAPPEGRGD